MAVLETAARNAACDAIVDLIDGGTGPGTLVFETSSDVEVATLTFSDPAFGAAALGTATANPIVSDSSATGGTIAQASIYDSNSVKIFEATTALSSAEITLSSVVIGVGDIISVTSLTVTVPAS